MKVLFTHSYFLQFDPKQWKTAQPYPPYGTMVAAACAREKGHEVRIYDTQLIDDPELIEQELIDFAPDVLVIYDDGFNYLTKMCLTNMREAAFRMQESAKKKNIRVLVCSSDSTDHSDDYLGHGADAVIRGEGEQALTEILSGWSHGESISNVPGIDLLIEGRFHRNEKREVMKDLDSLPMPAWDLIDLKPYRDIWMNAHGYFSLNIATTRGCPYKCNWCAKPIYGNRYNSRSPRVVVDELKMLKDEFHFDHIWFSDDIFGLKPGWVKEFSELVQKEKLQLKYKIQSRADLLVQENYVRDLASSGCETVWMGAESGSQKILDAMDKGTTIEQIREATGLLRKHHIHPAFFLQFGYPGETKEDIDKTIALLEELMPDDVGISVSYPLPGTVFYENVKKDLVNKQNWTDSNDLDLMFAGTYSREYYKTLHQYTHQHFRRLQGGKYFRKLFANPFRLKKSEWRRIFAWPSHLAKEKKEFRKLNAIGHGRD